MIGHCVLALSLAMGTRAARVVTSSVPEYLRPQLAEKRDPNEPDSYIPSPVAMQSMETEGTAQFREITVETPYTGGKKVLVIGTTKYLLEMANGKILNTGHQSSELLLPMYHLDQVGFKFDIATPDGGEVAIEEWTFPAALGYEDKIRGIRGKYKAQFEKPMKLDDVADNLEPYAAIFMPGGHGPIIEQPYVARIGELLRTAHRMSLPTISLCHGPAAMLAAAIGGDFPYKGYKMTVFPDKADAESPSYGYLPGFMKEEDMVEKNLVSLGVEIVNTEMDDSTHVDRELITGASQAASQTVSEAACNFLAEKYGFKVKF